MIGNLKKLVKVLTGQCTHPRDERARGDEYGICTNCGEEANAVRYEGKDKPAGFLCETCPEPHPIDVKNRLVCLTCGNELPEPTTEFRKYIRMRKHIRLRVGYPTDRNGKKLSSIPTFNVGLRYFVPGNPLVIRRVWITFTDKRSQKDFAAMLDRRMRFCSDDEGYNEVINEALDIIRKEMPEVEEQVVEHGENDTDEA